MTTPVTSVTGFLGSGKTTLVNRVLREPHGDRVAVIENEFGEVGVDAEFLSRTGEETIIQLANGCLCCTVRGDLACALQELVQQGRERKVAFERVLIETTGIADPGPVIQTFLAETEIQSWFHLDGVVAIVDGQHARMQAERLEFRAQVGYADRIIISKSDLLAQAEREAVDELLASLNPRAPAIACDLRQARAETLLGHIFETCGFASDYVPPEELRRALQGLALLSPGGRIRPPGIARHTGDVVSCVFATDDPVDFERLNQALDDLVDRYGALLWRCKGIVRVEGQPRRLVLQGVQGLIQISGGTMWRPREARRTVLVFIGLQLDSDDIAATLRTCQAPPVAHN
jgi:G3E family GTPase